MPITPLPTPVPSRADPANFAARGDAFLAALPTFATEANALATEVNENAAICESAAQTVNVSAWISGASYPVGANVYDTTNFLTYRRKVAGIGSTRPGLDGTNWQLLTGFGDVDSVSSQTIGGTKTFSSPIGGSVTGSAASITGVNPVANGGTGVNDGRNLAQPGDIVFTAKNTAPTGTIKANGAAVSRTTYAALFAAIGTTFGVGNGSSTFNVPDLRGEFIRGWDDGRGVDSGRAFGSAQSSQNLAHTHAPSAGGAFYTSVGGSGAFGGGSIPVLNDGATSSSGGTEARPRSVALLACIKF